MVIGFRLFKLQSSSFPSYYFNYNILQTHTFVILSLDGSTHYKYKYILSHTTLLLSFQFEQFVSEVLVLNV